ncbi:MAG: DUF1501 domain-containing protein [Rhodocyclaceae bacterium]|nr:DUF1501 domain-containing protein [Rhodocyclaceae bacterium]MCA3083453.1 DUF1501 domain-containing protein [Rhodocyclaceae bacterium]
MSQPTAHQLKSGRRAFLKGTSALALAALPGIASRARAQSAQQKLVVMVYLKGGNDGYNTLAPVTNSRYRRLRPNLAQSREQVLMLNETHGLHRSLDALLPLWQDNQLAILQGIGQQDVTNQHYRDAETLFTASRPDEFLVEGWMTRALNQNVQLKRSNIDVVAFGDLDIREADPMGPFRGGNAAVGVVNMLYPKEWQARHRVSETAHLTTTKAGSAAETFTLDSPSTLKTTFPGDSFGAALQSTVELAATGKAPPVVHITLNAEDGDQHNAFDTHWTQLKFHGPVLERLAKGLAAFRRGMQEIGWWDNTLVFTYDEFGRSPKENAEGGTHHGWSSVHFAMGGRVNGGLIGEAMPVVDVFQIDGPPPVIDYRALYTTVIENWWGGSANGVFAKRFKPLPLLRA